MRRSRPRFAEFVGTFWSVLGGCGSAVLAGGVSRALLRPRPSAELQERPPWSPGRWVAPSLLTLVFAGVVLFAARSRPPAPPRAPAAEASRGRRDLDQAFASICRTLNGINDEASAAAALPRLRELKATVDALRREAERLPLEERARLEEPSSPRLEELRSAYRRAILVPGASGPVQSVLADLRVGGNRPLGPAPADRPEEAR